jgi:hypothetical protein
MYASTLLLVPPAAGADQPGPMQALANDLGTPKLGYTARNNEHTNSLFEFVPRSQTVNNWTKMLTIVATRVQDDRTPKETMATIVRLRQQLALKHATIHAYDVRNQAPPVAFFSYELGGETDVGVIFSPIPGVVTVQEVAAHSAGVITPRDIARIKSLVGYPG